MNNDNQILTDSALPKGWTYCSLKDVVISQKGKRPLKLSSEQFEGSIPYLDIKAIETGIYDNYADEISSVVITEKDLVVVWDGSRSGWVGRGKNGALGSTLVSLTPILIDHNFLYYFLKYKFETINSSIKGAGIPHVNQDVFWKMDIPLAPIKEQKRISLKIEEALQKLSSTQLSVEKVPEIVNAAKQKILALAFSGDLSADWRRNNPRTFIEELNNYQQDDIGWYNVKAKDCCIKVSNGSTPKGKRFGIEVGIPFLKVYNIVDQKINFGYKPQFIEEQTHKKQSKSIVYPNDVLINIVGPPLGKVALVPYDYSEWNMNQALVLFRPNTYLLPEYLYYFLVEGSQIKLIENQYKGSAGQSNISLTQCRNFEIKIPSVEEQREIIKRISDRFNELDAILKKSVQIKQSISASIDKVLEEAYKGELTEQETSDETTIISFIELRDEKERLMKEIRHKKKIKAMRKHLIMATKKAVSLETILNKEFGKKEFSFKDIEPYTDLEYEELKDEIFSLLERTLIMRFDSKSETIYFKIADA